MQREKPPEWREKQKGSRGIRRGQRYRLVFQFPIRERCLIPPIELVDVFNQRHFLILRNNAKSYSNLLYDFYFASD
ncbi:hypothetical protein A4N18_21595 [Salmonella enterica subsp. enterica]|nr:hypothetical protein [Salmonella enterica subsp. enterica serovar Java]